MLVPFPLADTGRIRRKDPANFINRWLASQARDLDAILGRQIGVAGENGGNIREEDLRRTDLFKMPWVSARKSGIMRGQILTSLLCSWRRLLRYMRAGDKRSMPKKSSKHKH
jgi:hypothetical protein